MGFNVPGKQSQAAAIEGGRQRLEIARTLAADTGKTEPLSKRQVLLETERLRTSLGLANAHAAHPDVAKLVDQLHLDAMAAGDPIGAAYFQALSAVLSFGTCSTVRPP